MTRRFVPALAGGLAAALALCGVSPALAAGVRDQIPGWIDAEQPRAAKLADFLWEKAELGYLETESAKALIARLEEAGFSVTQGAADIPTAFVARYAQGSGGPVIGILAELDALPGISQDRTPERREVAGKDAAHACGHHLFGAGSTAAALAVKRWLIATKTPGEIRLYGTPAEEGGSGKVYLARGGLFDDVAVVLHWHPDDENAADASKNLANRSARFTFTGVASHAAGAPHRGRSALDGVEAMNMMVNLMREHVSQDTRIHYVITQGGEAPNVVPDSAQSYYYVRHPSVEGLEEVWARVLKAAEGAALGTGTTVSHEVMHGNRPLLSLTSLQKKLHANLSAVGGVTYDAEEQAFAEILYKSVGKTSAKLGDQERVKPFAIEQHYGSTDVGDVSWVAPTGGMRAATWAPGTSAHSWQAVAAGGMSIGHKGMAVAAKTLALTAVDLIADEALRKEVRAEWEAARGPDFKYYPLLGDRAPPLDYRKTN